MVQSLLPVTLFRGTVGNKFIPNAQAGHRDGEAPVCQVFQHCTPETAGEAFLWERDDAPPFDPEMRLPFAAAASVVVEPTS